MSIEIAGTRPRVGIFTRPIDQGTSGSGHHLLEMVNHILALNTEFDISLIHYRQTDKAVYRQAHEIIIPRNPLHAARVLRPYGFRLLHHSPLTIFSPLWGLSAKRVATIHGAEPNIIPQYYSVPARLHARLIKPGLARKMDRIFTVSETSKRYYVEHWGVQPDRIAITYNACAPAYRRLAPPYSVLDRLGIHGPYLFHISKYSHRKNPECILRAFEQLTFGNAIPGLKLVLAGSGWRNADVEEFLSSRRLSGRVVFTGFAAEDDVVQLYNGALAFLFPSRAEGFGMPNVEAMACGCPVITTNVFAVPEIVGDAALVMNDPEDYDDLAQKVIQIHADAQLRSTLVERGYQRAAQFSWETSARTVLREYHKLVFATDR